MRSDISFSSDIHCAFSFEILKPLAEHVAHLDDAIGHLLQLGHPLRLQLRVTEDLGNEGSSLLRRRGIHRAHHQLDLREPRVRALLVRADEVEDADALAVEAEVLREGLRQHELEPALLKEPRGEVVLLEVSARIALVRVVQQRNQLRRLDRLHDLNPLLVGRVNAGRVVRARMKQDDAS